MPDKKLEKASKAQTRRILKRHRLRKIVKLPDALFVNTGVTTSVFVFETGLPQNGHEVFTCHMKDDGHSTVKNKGRHDTHGRWEAIENHWVKVVSKQSGDESCRWIKPEEHLSYQTPREPFSITEEDFRESAMNYIMYRSGIDKKEFGDSLLGKMLYDSEVSADENSVSIVLRRYDNE